MSRSDPSQGVGWFVPTLFLGLLAFGLLTQGPDVKPDVSHCMTMHDPQNIDGPSVILCR